jgi:hypothetical protein
MLQDADVRIEMRAGACVRSIMSVEAGYAIACWLVCRGVTSSCCNQISTARLNTASGGAWSRQGLAVAVAKVSVASSAAANPHL